MPVRVKKKPFETKAVAIFGQISACAVLDKNGSIKGHFVEKYTLSLDASPCAHGPEARSTCKVGEGGPRRIHGCSGFGGWTVSVQAEAAGAGCAGEASRFSAMAWKIGVRQIRSTSHHTVTAACE